MTLHAALVIPDRELWSGEARTVIAKTTEGDIGVLTGHSPVFGALAEGSLVRILTEDTAVTAAVSGGFLSQPMYVAEQFTGQPGVFTPLEETISSFKAISEGQYDHLPEQAFYMVGGIEEAVEKAKKIAQG